MSNTWKTVRTKPCVNWMSTANPDLSLHEAQKLSWKDPGWCGTLAVYICEGGGGRWWEPPQVFPLDVGRELLPQFSQKKKIPKLGKGGWKNAAVSTRLLTHCGRTRRHRVFWPLWCKLHMMLLDLLTCWYIWKTSRLRLMSCYTRKATEICMFIYLIYLGKECLWHGHIFLPRDSLTGYDG